MRNKLPRKRSKLSKSSNPQRGIAAPGCCRADCIQSLPIVLSEPHHGGARLLRTQRKPQTSQRYQTLLPIYLCHSHAFASAFIPGVTPCRLLLPRSITSKSLTVAVSSYHNFRLLQTPRVRGCLIKLLNDILVSLFFHQLFA